MKSVAIVLAVLLSAPCFAAAAQSGAPPIARVTIDQAQSIALKARPGRIIDTELEKGGTGLRYSFGIKAPNGFYEVAVDAMTGRVLANSR